MGQSHRRVVIIVLGFISIVLVLTLINLLRTSNGSFWPKPTPPFHIRKFSNKVVGTQYFQRLCFRGKGLRTLRDLALAIPKLKGHKNVQCQQQFKTFQSIYNFRLKLAHVVLPKPAKRRNETQLLIFIDHRYSMDGVVFNLARVASPPKWGDVKHHVRSTIEDSRKNCDFCSVANTTATDSFGMMESEHAVIVSNAFKCEKYHGLAIFKKHSAVDWNQEQFIDCMGLVLRWFRRVHAMSTDDVHWVMYWDLLLKSGVSQMHPHMHLELGNFRYFAKWNELYKAGVSYSRNHGGINYWSQLLQLNTALGLGHSYGDASVFAVLTPKRDYEVMVISRTPCLDFFRLIFFTLRALMDDMGEPSVCMSWVFPKLNADRGYGDELPMIFRVVSRGDPVSLQSDISSFDLYGTPRIDRDPYKIIQSVRNSVRKRSAEKFVRPLWTSVNEMF